MRHAMAAPTVRFRIDFTPPVSIGPGKIELLEAIRECGSLSQAARNLGMSYRRAWLLVDSLNGSFREPVTLASTGGKGGGGVLVTEFGRTVIDTYRQLERDISTLAARRLRVVAGAVARHQDRGAKPRRRPLVPRAAPLKSEPCE